MKMNYAEPLIDAYNVVTGTIVAVLSYILGEHWFLFAAFLGLNVADWLTGWMKSKIAGERCPEEAGVLAHDRSGLRSKRHLYRDRQGNRN